ncbi:uncharacterized protein BXZ73DRAFT_101247 [Epithele typhae]|uniref:uncharacterized protein n=1 Tax=Epithele typhae TaxID=378194 RepID=UPI002007CFEF|nr:uncharacterized protein BXZ73DRAFT_101247 [Epithele typhae]KAH9932705.1 hypothetical protein BXZ73DRAFT_101247 [Epithele typhae]
MPSISRVLVLAVLGVSLSVQAIPVPEAQSTDVELFSNDARLADASGMTDPEMDDEEVDTDDYEVEFAEPEDADVELERRAAAKAKAPVKAPAKAPVKTAPPAKAPAKAPAAPAKAPAKAPAAPAKAPAAPAKAPAAPAKGKTCAPNKFKNKRDVREVPFSDLDHLFKRDSQEFVGWHGTNSDTAAFWAQQGQLAKPTKADGLFDFIGLGPKSAAGSSGADAENGPGVYVTDDKAIAIAFANNNAKVNKGTTAMLCAIFAKSSANWRAALRKAFLPQALVGDSATASVKAAKEQSRTLYLQAVVPGVSAANVVRFSLLDRSAKTGQMVLPAGITNQFTAQCVAATSATLPAGTSTFPAFTYNGASLRSTWDIAAEQTC